MNKQRINEVVKNMQENNLDYLLISEPSSIDYLINYVNNPGERMYVLMLGANGDHCLFFNKLFFVENDLGIEIAWHSDTDDPTASIASKIAGAKTVGVDKHWSAHFLLSLMEKMPDTKFVNGSKCVDYVRMVKDKEEQELMIKASKINDKAIDKIIDYLYHSDVTSMQFQILTNDGEVDFFSNQAIEHMKDVKVLFIGGIRLCYLCIVLFVLCVIYLIFRRKYIANSFLKTYLIIVGIFILFGLLISLFAISNFDLAFEIFHFIIFPDNSKAYLALSFHACDTLTNVLTSEFFMHIGIIIGITFIGILFLSVVICILLHKYGNLIQTK